jgi:hypothetical protein
LKSLEVLIPVLYLKGISTGDFAEALAALPSWPYADLCGPTGRMWLAEQVLPGDPRNLSPASR